MAEHIFTCGLDVALAVVGGKWKPLVLFHLGGGPRRFGALRRAVQGISEKVLIQQLRELQGDGVLSRTDYREVPPRVEYAMTAFGRTLAAALMPLCAWGEENREGVEAIQQRRSVGPTRAEAQLPKRGRAEAGSWRRDRQGASGCSSTRR